MSVEIDVRKLSILKLDLSDTGKDFISVDKSNTEGQKHELDIIEKSAPTTQKSELRTQKSEPTTLKSENPPPRRRSLEVRIKCFMGFPIDLNCKAFLRLLI